MSDDLCQRDEDRFIKYRTQYIERTTNLAVKKAKVLTLSELGYSTNGIAKRVEHTESTVDGYLDKMSARFGPRAVMAKPPDEIEVRRDITTASPEDIAELPELTQQRWVELVQTRRHVAPDWAGDVEDTADIEQQWVTA